MSQSIAKSDDELWVQLDAPIIWLVRGGTLGVVGAPATLRGALKQAHHYAMQGGSPGPIVEMPNDQTVIQAEQIFRLWKRLGLVSGTPQHP